MPALSLRLLENLLSLVANLLTVALYLLITCLTGCLNILFANALSFSQLLIHSLNHAFRAMYRQEWLNKINIFLLQNIHIPPNILRIGGYYWTVKMIGRGVGLVLHIIRQTRIENLFDSLFHQIHNMTMSQLGRIAKRIGRHCSHPLVIHLGRRFPRKHYLIAQLGKNCKPEWIVLIHIQHPRQTNFSTRGIS